VHVALRAPDRAAVDKFCAAGLKAGGRDNGTPGLRLDYSPDYDDASLIDPDGNNVEAVFMKQRGSLRDVGKGRSSIAFFIGLRRDR
jgi:hypothetical protein